MNKLAAAALGAALAIAVSTAPVRADPSFLVGWIVGAPVGVIWHSRVVYRCHQRELTREEAQRTMIFPVMSVLRAYANCRK